MNNISPTLTADTAPSLAAHARTLPRRLAAFAPLGLAVFSTLAHADGVIANAGFEAPAQPVNDSFRYSPSISDQGGSGWVFGNFFAGVAAQGGAFFDGQNVAIPEGNQVGMLQQWSGMTFDLASMSQKIGGFSEGTYQVSFYAAGRQGYGANPLLIQIDPTVFDDGTVKFNGMIVTFDGLPSITPPEITGGDPFTYFTSEPFHLSAGSHTLSFSSAFSQKEDKTSFIDAVSITAVPAVPEASTCLAGGGLMLIAAMSVRHARARHQVLG